MSAGLAALFSAVETADKAVTAGLKLFNIAEPVITGVIRGVKALRNKDGSVDYIIVLQAGQAELDQADAKADASLALIDEELKRLAALGEEPTTEVGLDPGSPGAGG